MVSSSAYSLSLIVKRTVKKLNKVVWVDRMFSLVDEQTRESKRAKTTHLNGGTTITSPVEIKKVAGKFFDLVNKKQFTAFTEIFADDVKVSVNLLSSVLLSYSLLELIDKNLWM